MEVLEDLRAFIAYRVREGFKSVHEIIKKNATDYALGKYKHDDLQPEIKRLTAQLLAKHRSERARHRRTDCDRLDETRSHP